MEQAVARCAHPARERQPRARDLDRPARGAAALCLALAATLLAVPEALAQTTPEVVDESALRVCADPHNLPFSNEAGEGFENAIAELLAADLGLPLRYTWYPQATGFIRQTLRARRCDVIIGVPSGNEMVQNTNPYYRSTYVMVYRSDAGITARDAGDPQLRELRLGVIAGTPPASLLAEHGLMDRVRPYHLTIDTRFNSPAHDMMQHLAEREIDVAFLWGPIAGYHARRLDGAYTLEPLRAPSGWPRLQYRFSMGIRFNEPEWKLRLNEFIATREADIRAIHHRFGTPLLDERGELIRP